MGTALDAAGTVLGQDAVAAGVVSTARGAMAKFGDMRTLQKSAAVHASIHNRFNQDRHLNRRDIFKQNRSSALAEWRELMA